MKALGIVAEYNPFHNGHKYHIEKSKEVSACSHVVCVMSGSFVQRGEFAIFNKWERAKSALLNGADLVIELPCYYVLQSAENFAYGAVRVLNSLGIVDSMSFGSETDNLEKLSEISKIVNGNDKVYNDAFKNAIQSGLSYPVARSIALKKRSNSEFDKEILSPNNLLGIYYLNALSKLGSNIKPYCIKRHKTLHNLQEQNENFATASHIRNLIKEKNNYDDFIPSLNGYESTFFAENISDYILGVLRYMPIDDNVIGFEVGMANYIKECAKSSSSLEEFYGKCATKRYTKSRIKRAVLASMIGMNEKKNMDYIRVLGFNKNGAKLLKEIKDKSQLDIVVKTADFNIKNDSMFKYDILATDLAYFSSKDKNIGMDYKMSPIVL